MRLLVGLFAERGSFKTRREGQPGLSRHASWRECCSMRPGNGRHKARGAERPKWNTPPPLAGFGVPIPGGCDVSDRLPKGKRRFVLAAQGL